MDEQIDEQIKAERRGVEPPNERLLLGILEPVVRCVPLSVLHRLGAFAARVAWLARSRSRTVTEINIRRAFPELDPDAQALLARHSLRDSGRLIMESLAVWSRRPEQVLEWIVDVRGAELLAEAHTQGRGAICLVPHFGNWEVLCVYLASHFRFAAMYERQRIAWVDRWVARGRRRSGARLTPATLAGLRGLRRALRAGQVVAVMPDQVPVLGSGERASFFGHPALTGTLAWRLAVTSGAPVFVASARRRDDARTGFAIRVTRFEPGWSSMDQCTALTAMNLAVEQLVREAPTQYQWEYKRFKHAVPGVDTYKQR